MQNPFGGKQPIGVVYNTSMSRPDAALALALLYGLSGKREARVGSVCVTGAGLEAATFCDLVGLFYTPGPPRNANQVLPTGLALETASLETPMVRAAMDRKKADGNPQYARTIRKVSDTSVAEAVLRNGVIFNAEAVVVLSAPATYLAKTLDLQGVKELYEKRVKMLVIVDAGGRQDVPAMRRLLAEWPGPIALCGKEIGPQLTWSGATIDADFSWAPAHPVVDAYKAFRPMPFDAPLWDLAGVLYAVHPTEGYFQTQAGTIQVSDGGELSFAAGAGKHVGLQLDPAGREKTLKVLMEVASAKPPVPQPGRGRGPQAAAAAEKKVDPAPGVVKQQ
ncbi:MAG: hypothetical protein JWN34_3914 [Bryobacterales bacterium]|nr:hypothetical protein [Bryobacterales bacterium]